MWNLFGTTSYGGSNSEQLMQGRVAEIGGPASRQ